MENEPQRARTPRIQIGLSALFGVTAVVAVLFGVLRWLEVPPRASLLVLAILTLGSVAAVGLVVVLARSLAAGETSDVRDERNGP